MKYYYYILVGIILLSTLSSCRDDELLVELSSGVEDYSDWSDPTHGNETDPNYSVVFNQTEVLRFDIEISSQNWTVMQSDLASNLIISRGPGGMALNSDYNPIWVPSTIKFNGIEWYQVGVRYKGNSSLQSAYQSGINKLSFKLDFDEFEDYYPEIKNQRFYGFKQLNLKNNFDDESLMREKVGADLFRQFGLASSETAFCVVYVDHGNGPEYFGVYTLVEEVDDTVIGSQFDNDSGNLYKPDGDAASFAYGTYDDDEMEKKSNEDLADYTDVRSLYDIINSSMRTTDEEAWKTELNAILDVDEFLRWLAANTAIQNWDTYGVMTHNYYLYNNPTTSKLTWIPWDNNEAFQTGKNGGALSFSFNEVSSNWPLIRYIIDIEEYREKYDTYLEEFITDVFVPADMIAIYEEYYDMLKEHAYNERNSYTFLENDSDFDNAVNTLKTHAQSRTDAVLNYLR